MGALLPGAFPQLPAACGCDALSTLTLPPPNSIADVVGMIIMEVKCGLRQENNVSLMASMAFQDFFALVLN